MAKAIAKRKLRSSYLNKNSRKKENKKFDILNKFNGFQVLEDIKKIKMDSFEQDSINGIYKRNGANKNIRSKKEDEDFFTRLKKKFVLKVALQTVTMVSILAFCLCVKYMDLKIVKNSEVCKNIIKEFNTNYTKEEILKGIENVWDQAYFYIDPIVPDSLSQKTVAAFSNMFKKNATEEQVTETKNVVVYEEKQVKIYEEPASEVENQVKEDEDGKNANLTEEEKNIIAIKASGVNFTKPTVGVITSAFGEREVIFEGTESYHFGTDIANVTGTNIYSSIDGEVTVCSTNNETGKYIEIQNGSITTRYCHLSEQLVSVGDEVKAGSLIGKMGETGMATGPHLHFEIMYNRQRVDAQKILELV